MQLIGASEAVAVIGGSEHTAVGLLPYASNVSRVTSVSLPWNQAVKPEDIRLSRYSRIVVIAASRLAVQPETQNITIVAAGEHTFGKHNPSTSELMYRELTRRGIGGAMQASEQPTNANTTAAQLFWLANWRTRHPSVCQGTMLIVGYRQHSLRTALFANRVGLSDALFVDAKELITELDDTRLPKKPIGYDYERQRALEAMALYDEKNAPSEARLLRTAQVITRIGLAGIRLAYWAGSHVVSPNIIDATSVTVGGPLRFEGPLSARQKVQKLQEKTNTPV